MRSATSRACGHRPAGTALHVGLDVTDDVSKAMYRSLAFCHRANERLRSPTHLHSLRPRANKRECVVGLWIDPPSPEDEGSKRDRDPVLRDPVLRDPVLQALQDREDLIQESDDRTERAGSWIKQPGDGA